VWHLALVGVRRGELCGLRWTDIAGPTSPSRRRRSAVRSPASSSTARSSRATPSPRPRPCATANPGAAGAQGCHAHAGRGAARRRGPTYERSGYVVVDPLGRRYHPDTVSDYWAAACANAGVKRIRLHHSRHTLRHAHAAGAQRAGGDHLGVARARRHRVHYAHLCAQPSGEAGPRGREHLVVDEA
jgi:integrase